MLGFYPQELKPLATPGAWFQYMAFPWFLIAILFLALLYMVFKPREPLKLSREAFRNQYRDLGRITRDEIVCAIILMAALILFSTDKWTGIKTPEAAMIAFAALMLFGIIKLPDISSGVNWDIINFFAVVMSLTAMFVEAGVSDWAKPIIEPGILSLADSPLTFLLCRHSRPVGHTVHRHPLGFYHNSPSRPCIHTSLSEIRPPSRPG